MTEDIAYSPGFVAEPDALFARLRAETAWDTRMKARLTASWGVPYDYSQLTYAEAPFPPALEALRARVAARVGHPVTNCLANLYEDGTRTMGWHSDSEEAIAAGSSIAIVSLGAVRTLEFRETGSKEVARAYPLEPGSLLVMAPGVQQRWQHRVPRSEGAGARISLTFRHIVGVP